MRKYLRLLLYGVVSWLLIFAASVCVFPLKESRRALYENVMGFTLTLTTVLCTILYFRKVRADFVREGLLLGVAFVLCNILCDLPMFVAGPMQMALADYWQDIGLAYPAMAVVSTGIGYAIARATRDGQR